MVKLNGGVKTRYAPVLLSLMALTTLMLLMTPMGRLQAGEPSAKTVEPLTQFPQASVQVGSVKTPFKVWLAATYERREQGLMFVKHLNPDQGMLFVFDTVEPQAFWMKNTFIPLDILYISSSYTVIHIAANAKPHSLDPIQSLGPVKWVLELPGGSCSRLNIAVGDSVALKP